MRRLTSEEFCTRHQYLDALAVRLAGFTLEKVYLIGSALCYSKKISFSAKVESILSLAF
jgi:hypothetical protein